QSRASVLVNPRTNEGEYTKYSFPSKTMEYLAAGKPVIMHKLDGIPDEYDEYLYYINGSSAEDLKDAIVKACSKTDDELALFGAKASRWVLKEKSPSGQAKKIIRMIEK
ncbi:MAG: glycosyltransferase, partial [Clostridia bacterium]|nr:glycosyltransferase [Clostridia bacterium]